MNKSPFDNFIAAIYNLSFKDFPHLTNLVSNAQKHEQLIHEIAVLTDMTPQEVQYFYQTHNYDLEFIKFAVAICGSLNEKDMQIGILSRYTAPVLNWDYISENFIIEEGLQSKIASLIYNIGYYLTKPFIWSIYHFLEGIKDAKGEIWE